MSGWFGFETSGDLLQKLERELSKLRDNPADSDAAYNFFVTAWSLVDWFHPNDSNAREQLRSSNPILQVCAHLADGSKHFQLSNPRHQSVVNTTRGGNWAKRPLGLSPGKRPLAVTALFVHLVGVPTKHFGSFPSAIQLAEATLQWFKTYPQFQVAKANPKPGETSNKTRGTRKRIGSGKNAVRKKKRSTSLGQI